jgi:protein LTV1
LKKLESEYTTSEHRQISRRHEYTAIMPRRKFIDKKNATTFALVHRAQNDPLINDEDAPSMVFAEKQSRRGLTDEDDDAYPDSSASSMISGSSARSRKVKQRGDLEEEFGVVFRPNEGEAAEHGVYFDDTKYDYMQHMRELGTGGGPATWVPATGTEEKSKGKSKQKLEDALRDMDLVSESGSRYEDAQSMGQSSMASSAARSLLPEELLPSEFVKRRTYQDQQDVPDEIAGFQPDMDPRLREALEALEDEAYVDDEDDIFGELTSEGREVDIDEWERLGEQQMFAEGEADLDDGWESDDTIKAASPSLRPSTATILELPADLPTEAPTDVQAQPPADPTQGAWLDEFKKFNADAKAGKDLPNNLKTPDAPPSALASSALFSTATGRTKKRKGAKTSTTNYSMSSSALQRTDQQTLLDDRFDRIENAYAENEFGDDEEGQFDDAASLASGMTGGTNTSRISRYSTTSGMSGMSRASGVSSYSRASDSEAPMLERTDFNSIMDGFLAGHSKQGKRGQRVKKAGFQTGMEQLDEVRRGLGPARFKA